MEYDDVVVLLLGRGCFCHVVKLLSNEILLNCSFEVEKRLQAPSRTIRRGELAAVTARCQFTGAAKLSFTKLHHSRHELVA